MFVRSYLAQFFGIILLSVTLSACGDSVAINDTLEKTDRQVSDAMSKFEKKEDSRRSPLTVSDRPWYGQSAINIESGSPLPDQLTAGDSLTLTFDEPLTLRQTANLIQSVSGLRIMINAAGGGAGNAPSTEGINRGFLPVNGRQVRGGKMIWQGALNDLLDQVADNFDASWSFDGGAITINEEVTKTFMLHSLATVVSETSSVEGGSTGSSGGSTLPSVETQGTTELNVWEEVRGVVDSIVDGRGRATFSPSTGTITVSGSPNAIQKVEDYLRFQNGLRLRRIAVSVRVLELTIGQDVNTTVSTTQILERIINNADIQLASGTGGLSGTLATSGTFTDGDIQAAIEASKDVERVSVVHSGAVVTLSDQPAPLQVGRQISYLARRSSTSGTDTTGGTETLEPGTVDVGLIMNVLPRVIEDDRVILRVNVALTDTETPFPTFPLEPSSDQIQLPEVDSTGFQQNTVLRSGETLVLAGFERNESSINDLGTPGLSFLLGGSRQRTQRREVTVMLITANIMPEDPFTVYANNK